MFAVNETVSAINRRLERVVIAAETFERSVFGEFEANTDSRTRHAIVNYFFAGRSRDQFQFVFWKTLTEIPKTLFGRSGDRFQLIFWNILRPFPTFCQQENVPA